MSGNDQIADIRRKHAEKYAQHIAKKMKEERAKEEAIRLENEEKLLKEIQYKESFELLLNILENLIGEIRTAQNILEINLHVSHFTTALENGIHFLNYETLKNEVSQMVIYMIGCVSQNENSKFNVTIKDINKNASTQITKNIKKCLKIINYDENDIGLELMNTQNDVDFAQKIYNDECQDYEDVPIGQNANKRGRMHFPNSFNKRQKLSHQFSNLSLSQPNNFSNIQNDDMITDDQPHNQNEI